MNYSLDSKRKVRKSDRPRHRGLRQKLIANLSAKGIADQRVLQAMLSIPRHFMIDEEFVDWAYRDIAFPIEADQTISMPYTVAMQSQLLEVQPGDKILEVGTGSGYQAAVLYVMGAKVYTIERQRDLFDKTSILLNEMGYHRIRTLYGDGYIGAQRFAPFDKIIVTAGTQIFPHRLFEQVKIGGIMVIPQGGRSGQEMMRYIKTSKTTYLSENHGSCAFVPMLSGTR